MRRSTFSTATLGLAGVCANVGGFLWTGIYVPHNGKLGLGLFILSVAFIGAFIGATEKKTQAAEAD